MDLSGIQWRKSKRSGIGGCVEVAVVGDRVAVRDSKHPQGPVLVFSRTEWHAFVVGVQEGQFDV